MRIRTDVLITVVSAALTIIITVYGLPYAAPYLGVITSFLIICFVISLYLGLVLFGELTLIFSDTGNIEYYINTYVIPWQKEFVTRISLTNKELLNARFDKAKDHLESVIRFLETTDNTKYLRGILVMPSLRANSIFVLKHWLRKCNLDMLSSKIKILKHLELMMTAGREREISAYIADIADSIVPYRRVCRGLAKLKSVDGGFEEILPLGIEDGTCLDVSQDIASVHRWEMEIWNSRIPARSEEMTRGRLGREALRAIMLAGIFLVLSILVLAVLAYFALKAVAVRIDFLIYMGTMTAFLAALMVMAVRSVLLGAKNYPALAKLLESRTVFALGDIRRASARIIEDGLDTRRLSKVVSFDGKNVSAWDFVCCCASASLKTRQYRMLEPLVWFPTNHSVRVRSEHYFCFRAPVSTGPFHADLEKKRYLTRPEFVNLSSRIVNMREREVQNVAGDERQVKRLLWLYSNALRIGLYEFDRIEVANVGRLPCYLPVHHETGWRRFGRLKRRILRAFSTGVVE